MNNSAILDPAQWISKYADALFAYAIVRVNDTATAEDIVQETFLSAWKAREKYNGASSEKNWLYAICKNKIVDHYRKQLIQIVTTDGNSENCYFDNADHWTEETSPNDWGIDYAQPIETKEFYSILEACRKRLKDIQQTIFVMKYMEDMESEHICKALELTSANYWVLVHRAKLQLRACMEKNWIKIN